MNEAPGWFEKRLTACWLFGWAFVMAIIIPDEVIAAVAENLREIMEEKK